MAGNSTNGLPVANTANGTLPLTGNERFQVDTGLGANGQTPATQAITTANLTTLGQGNIQTLTYAANLTIDLSTGSYFRVVLTGNTTVSFINPGLGQDVWIEFIQDGTGSRTVTFTAGTVTWPGGTAVVLTTAANATDVVELVYNPFVGKFRGDVIGKAFA